jgi:hypothetical protein
LEQLWEWGVDISSGQLNRILTEDKDIFHKEKDAILSGALAQEKSDKKGHKLPYTLQSKVSDFL